ncbi:ParB/RepB/Spo0J family partition protein [Azospirillum sp.]|uniref:ParB/RepB/Spo0J family partition protein n=1 Tax=Azospirillum sp. TaxID=34012 RepID=UPI003D721CCC
MSRNLLSKGKAEAPDSSRQAHGHALFVLAKGGPQIVEAEIDRIVSNPGQPRQSFDEDDIASLAESIRTYGLQQPIGLQSLPDGRWQLVFGERRLRAIRRLERSTIAGILVSGDLDEIALIENVQRIDLNPFEEAFAFDRLRQRHGYSHDALAKVVGRSKSMVTKTLMLLRLSDSAHEEYMAAADKPTFRGMYEVAAIADASERNTAWKGLIAGGTAPATSGEREPASNRFGNRSDQTLAGLSALSIRVTRNLLRARDTLNAMQDRRPDLKDFDREMLREIRDMVDALLSQQED